MSTTSQKSQPSSCEYLRRLTDDAVGLILEDLSIWLRTILQLGPRRSSYLLVELDITLISDTEFSSMLVTSSRKHPQRQNLRFILIQLREE